MSAPGVPDRPSVTGLCPRVPGTRARAAALIRPSRIPRRRRRRRRRPGKSALSGRPSARFWRRAVDALSGRRGATPLVRRPRPPTRSAKTAAKRRRREMATRHEPGAALISVIKSQKNYGSAYSKRVPRTNCALRIKKCAPRISSGIYFLSTSLLTNNVVFNLFVCLHCQKQPF